jgi:hypothetical protein
MIDWFLPKAQPSKKKEGVQKEENARRVMY